MRKGEKKVSDKRIEYIMSLPEDWEQTHLIREMTNEFGGAGSLFCLRMFKEIALAKDNKLDWSEAKHNEFMDLYVYNSGELERLLKYSISDFKIFEVIKDGEDKNKNPIKRLISPIFNDLFKIKENE